MDPQAFVAQTDRFARWFQTLPGSTFHKDIKIVDLRHRGAGRGIVATSDIEADTVLFSIPRGSILTVSTSDLSTKISGLDGSSGEDGEENDVSDPWVGLILTLIYERLKGNSSRWQPYLDILPEQFETLMFWSAEELRELQGSHVLTRIGREGAEEMFRSKVIETVRSHPELFDTQQTDEELIQLCHAMGSAIMAYSFDLEKEEDDESEGEDGQDGWVEVTERKKTLGMVPMADMLNADAEYNAHISHDEDCLTATALRTIRAGDEIVNFYGPLGNSELLRRYGYVTRRHSRFDAVEIPWATLVAIIKSTMGVTDDTWASAKKLMDLDEIEEEDSFVLERACPNSNSDGTFDSEDIPKVNNMPEEMMEQVKAAIKAVCAVEPTLASEKRKRHDLRDIVAAKAVDSMLESYPTSMQEDEALLAQADLPERRRMAVQVRLGEKRLLVEAKQLLAARLGSHDAKTEGRAKRPKA